MLTRKRPLFALLGVCSLLVVGCRARDGAPAVQTDGPRAVQEERNANSGTPVAPDAPQHDDRRCPLQAMLDQGFSKREIVGRLTFYRGQGEPRWIEPSVLQTVLSSVARFVRQACEGKMPLIELGIAAPSVELTLFEDIGGVKAERLLVRVVAEPGRSERVVVIGVLDSEPVYYRLGGSAGDQMKKLVESIDR